MRGSDNSCSHRYCSAAGSEEEKIGVRCERQSATIEKVSQLIVVFCILFDYRRKKFESPQQPTATSDSPFSARGAIRRLSLRDRSGMTLARLEAQKEQTDILRSWSKEDVSSSQVRNTYVITDALKR